MLTRQGFHVARDDETRAKRELRIARIDRSGIGSQYPQYVDAYWTGPAGRVMAPKYYSPATGVVPSDYGSVTLAHLTFSGRLREDLDQPRAIAAVTKSLQTRGGAVLSLGTGQGKTTCACYIAAFLGVKTVVLVHKDVLRAQWAERVAQFLPGARVSFVQGAQCDTSGDVVIAMLQTLVAPGRTFTWPGVGFVVADECLPYNQRVLTETGQLRIGTIFNMWKSGRVVNVQSFDEKTQSFVMKPVTHAWKKSATELVKVSYSKSNYRATPNHPVLTVDGWKQTGDIAPGDLLISRYDTGLAEQAVALAMNPDQYQVFLGSLLGDGHLHQLPSCRYRLVTTHGPKQLAYCQWKADMFDVKVRSFVGGYTNDTLYQFATKVIDLPAHKTFQSHKTHCPQWVLDDLDLRGLAIWIMDDGSLSRCGNMTISTHTFDEDTHRRMCLKLGKMGIDAVYSVAKKGDKSYFYLRINTVAGKYVADLIAPYVHPSMAYKVINVRSNVKNVGTYGWNRDFLPYGTLRVSSTEREFPEDTRVYDLEVDGTHTFVCSSLGGSGPVVHNCHHIAAETFSTAMRGLCAPYTLGLSATPQRKDGLTQIVHWFLGPLAYAAQRDEMRHVTVSMIRYDTPRYRLPAPVTKFGTVNFVQVISDIADDDVRTGVIVDAVRDIRAEDPRRVILILSHRRDHCIALSRRIPGAVAFLGGPKSKAAKSSKEHETAPVVCATYALASEGYDDSRLNTLVLATPCSDVTQAAGRILRGASGNCAPLIVDVMDDFGVAYAQGAKRRAFYKKSGFLSRERVQVYPKCLVIDT